MQQNGQVYLTLRNSSPETQAVATAYSQKEFLSSHCETVAPGPAHTILTAMKGSKWGGSQNVRAEHMCLGEN